MAGMTQEWDVDIEDFKTTHILKVFNFGKKMKTWVYGRSIDSNLFKVGLNEFALNIFPNGNEKDSEDCVVVRIYNLNDFKVHINYDIKVYNSDYAVEILAQSGSHVTLEKQAVGGGWLILFPHDQLKNCSVNRGGIVFVVTLSLAWEEDILGLKKDVGILKGDIGTMKGDVGTLKVGVASLKGDVGTLKGDVGALKGDVGTLKEVVGALKGDVGALKGDVGALKGDVGALKGDVGTLKMDVGELKEIVCSMERSLRNVILASAFKKCNVPCPECPVCYEDMKPPTRIFQCPLGHLTCQKCRKKPEGLLCPTCKQEFMGRAIGMEEYVAMHFG